MRTIFNRSNESWGSFVPRGKRAIWRQIFQQFRGTDNNTVTCYRVRYRTSTISHCALCTLHSGLWTGGTRGFADLPVWSFGRRVDARRIRTGHATMRLNLGLPRTEFWLRRHNRQSSRYVVHSVSNSLHHRSSSAMPPSAKLEDPIPILAAARFVRDRREQTAAKTPSKSSKQ
jgi:hypothetical protein